MGRWMHTQKREKRHALSNPARQWVLPIARPSLGTLISSVRTPSFKQDVHATENERQSEDGRKAPHSSPLLRPLGRSRQESNPTRQSADPATRSRTASRLRQLTALSSRSHAAPPVRHAFPQCQTPPTAVHARPGHLVLRVVPGRGDELALAPAAPLRRRCPSEHRRERRRAHGEDHGLRRPQEPGGKLSAGRAGPAPGVRDPGEAPGGPGGVSAVPSREHRGEVVVDGGIPVQQGVQMASGSRARDKALASAEAARNGGKATWHGALRAVVLQGRAHVRGDRDVVPASGEGARLRDGLVVQPAGEEVHPGGGARAHRDVAEGRLTRPDVIRAERCRFATVRACSGGRASPCVDDPSATAAANA
eukprot:scaffold1804_cov263-Pinguiococcus_pyrenoidosus.AAC.29